MRSILKALVWTWVAAAVAVYPVLTGAQTAAAPYVLTNSLTGFLPQAGGGFARVASVFDGTAGSRVWLAAASMDVTVSDAVVLAGRAGPLAVTASSTVAALDGALAVAGVLATPAVVAPAVVIGVGAAALYAANRILNPTQVPGSSVGKGLLDYDPGQAALTATCFGNQTLGGNNNPSQTGCYSSVASAAAADGPAYITSNFGAGGGSGAYSFGGVQSTTATSATVIINCGACTGSGKTSTQTWNYSSRQGSQCAASIDPLNSAYNVAAGSPVGSDGKCPTARYNHVAVTPQQAASTLVANPTQAKGDALIAALKEYLAGSSTASVPVTPKAITGPASQTGPATTTTTTTGGQTTNSSTAPSYNYTYSPTTINYTTSTTTTNGGTTTTTTAPTAAPQDPNDPCTANPNRVMCQTKVKIDESGTPPTSTALDPANQTTAQHQLDRITQIGNAVKQTSLGWSFPISFPVASCTPFHPWSPKGDWYIDPCTNPGVLTFRALLGWLLAGWTALYCWRSFTDLKA